jgi:colicin import membrane protein
VKQQPETPHALEKRRQPGRIRAIILAAAVHAAFFALIVFGVTWQSRPEAPVQAELWDKLPPAKTAKAPEPKVEPKVEPKPPEPQPPKTEPKPEPKVEPKPQPPKVDPAIAQKLEREKLEAEKKKEKAEREKREKQKEEEAKKKREQEEAAKKKREDEKRRQEEEKSKREAEKAREEAVAARKSEIDSFVQRIKDKIRNRANVPDTVTGNPEIQVRIRVLPGGEVLDITVTRRSGNSTYDAAIERGIRSASPLPVPAANSELFPQFRELTLNIKHER